MVTFSTSQKASLVVMWALCISTSFTYWNTYLLSLLRPFTRMFLLPMKG